VAIANQQNYDALFKELLQHLEILMQTLSKKFTLEDLSFTFQEEFLKKAPQILNEEIGIKKFGNINELKKNLVAFNEQNFHHNGNLIKMISFKSSSKFSEIREIATEIQEQAK
jgi:hypothetical protein